jgi:hypothetical protein
MTREQNQIIKDLQEGIDNFPAALSSGTMRVQREAFDRIIGSLSRFDLNPDGSLITNTANFGQIETIINDLRAAYLSPKYREFLREYLGGYDLMAEMTIRLFDTYGITPNITDAANAILANAKTNATRLLTQGAVDTALPSFREILNNAVARSEKFTDVIRNVRQNIEGSEDFQGRMERYAKQNAKDIFAVGHAQYMTAVGDAMGFEFYEYAGVNTLDSREFCLHRKGKVYHTQEIRQWATLDWDGKNRATTADTIFSLRGGYNCNHLLVPIATALVPEDVLTRARRKGYITDDDPAA